jgi:hypothetical protein
MLDLHSLKDRTISTIIAWQKTILSQEEPWDPLLCEAWSGGGYYAVISHKALEHYLSLLEHLSELRCHPQSCAGISGMPLGRSGFTRSKQIVTMLLPTSRCCWRNSDVYRPPRAAWRPTTPRPKMEATQPKCPQDRQEQRQPKANHVSPTSTPSRTVPSAPS